MKLLEQEENISMFYTALTPTEEFYSFYGQEYAPIYTFLSEHYENTSYRHNPVLHDIDGLYTFYRPTKTGNNVTGLENALHYYKNLNSYCRYRTRYQGESFNIYIGTGYILNEEGEILAITAGKTINHDFSTVFDSQINDVVKENVTLLITSEFATQEKYKNIFKKFYATFVVEAMERGIDVSYKPREKIENIVYRKILNIGNFVDLDEIEKLVQTYSKLVTLRSSDIQRLALDEELWEEQQTEL